MILYTLSFLSPRAFWSYALRPEHLNHTWKYVWHMDDRLPDMSLPGSNKPCHLACECPSRLLAVRISAGQKGCCVVESSFISPTQSCTVQHSNLPYTHGLGKRIPAVSMPTPRGVHSRIPGLVSACACVVPTNCWQF